MQLLDGSRAAGHSARNRQQSSVDMVNVGWQSPSLPVVPEEVSMKSGQSGIPDQPGQPLLELLLTEVVPRLTRLACGPGPIASSDRSVWPGRPVASMNLGDGPPQVGPLLVHALELAELCQHGRGQAAASLIAKLRESGVPVEAIFLQVIQPAAQHLGQGWSDDRLSFTDVTIGLGHLQQIFSGLLDDFQGRAQTSPPGDSSPDDAALSAFFCTIPGATHRLGVQMVRAFFARAGWRARLGHGDEATLVSQITAMRPGLIGLSLNSETDLRAAGALILRLRNATRSFQPTIMVGGAAVPFFPKLVERLDADIVSGDATDALNRATRLVMEHSVGTR
jgi:methanogenic corrinoid protein MtbC1